MGIRRRRCPEEAGETGRISLVLLFFPCPRREWTMTVPGTILSTVMWEVLDLPTGLEGIYCYFNFLEKKVEILSYEVTCPKPPRIIDLPLLPTFCTFLSHLLALGINCIQR